MQPFPIRHHTHRIHEVDEGIGTVLRQIVVRFSFYHHGSSRRGIENVPREFAILAEVEAMFGFAHVRNLTACAAESRSGSPDARWFEWNYVSSYAFWSACGTTGMRAEHL